MTAVSVEKETMLTLDLARRLFRYDPETGDLIILTGQRRGRPAKAKSSSGYLMVDFGGKRFLVHRIIWLLVHGEWPPQLIDHIDGNRANNVFRNLRLATPQQNMANMRLCRRNSSGVKGVRPAYGGKFVAVIHHNYGRIHLGTFSTQELAADAYAKAATELFGEFAKPA